MLQAKLSPGQTHPLLLHALIEIAEALNSDSLRNGLIRTLEIAARATGALGGALLLRVKGGEEIRIESSCGSVFQGAWDDAIRARVMTTGKPVILPQEARGVAGSVGRITFMCVPVTAGGSTAGAIGINIRHEEEDTHNLNFTFFTIVSSMIAQALPLAPALEAPESDDFAPADLASSLIGSSFPMREVRERVIQISSSPAPVLVRGESGAGKELVARTIHRCSPRRGGPFVAVRAGRAHQVLKRPELVQGGTVFLEEISELSPVMAARLLEMLPAPDFRFIVSTTTDLEKAVASANFREDLYLRLNLCPIQLPPLRERRQDIAALATHFVEGFNPVYFRRVRRIGVDAIEALAAHSWPGNVRELEHVIESAVSVCESAEIRRRHLPDSLQNAAPAVRDAQLSLRESVEAFEKNLLQDTMRATHGNQARAARILQTTERIFNYKVRKYRIGSSESDTARFSA
jgi:Nif-specific regulatory protein